MKTHKAVQVIIDGNKYPGVLRNDGSIAYVQDGMTKYTNTDSSEYMYL